MHPDGTFMEEEYSRDEAALKASFGPAYFSPIAMSLLRYVKKLMLDAPSKRARDLRAELQRLEEAKLTLQRELDKTERNITLKIEELQQIDRQQ